MSMPGGPADAYARYAELIVRQLEAVESGDLAALGDLMEERSELAEAIDALLEQTDVEVGEDARRQLFRCHAADLRLRARLAALRASALTELGHAGHVREAARTYVGTATAGTRLDVEL